MREAAVNGIMAQHTGKTAERVEKDSDRDNFMSAIEAKEYGIIDNVFEHNPIDRTKKE